MVRKIGITAGIVILILQIWMFVSSDFLFGAYAEIAETALIIYMLMFAYVMASYRSAFPTAEVSVTNFFWFIAAFGVTFFVVAFFPAQFTAFIASIEAVKVVIALGLLYAFVKAFIEEAIFRQILPEGTSFVPGIGKFWSSILFGLFHVAVLSASGLGIVSLIFALVWLSLLGYIWAIAKPFIGILGTTGSHFAYNLKALGVI